MNKIIETEFEGLKIIPPTLNDDKSFITYDKSKFRDLGITCNFIQDNTVVTKKEGTIRAFGYQKMPYTQAKLIWCSKGCINDIVIDLRKKSTTFLKIFSVMLSEKNKLALYIPKGFAHGYETLLNDTIIQYKVDEHYCASSEETIFYDDKKFNIKWRTNTPLLSEKDLNAKKFSEIVNEDLFNF